jgi:hypothetical protein
VQRVAGRTPEASRRSAGLLQEVAVLVEGLRATRASHLTEADGSAGSPPPSRAAAARRARRGRRLSARRAAARGAARALARRRAISTWAAWIRVASAPRDLCAGRRPRPDDEENRTCRKPITVSLQQTGIRPSGGNLDLVATVRTCSTPRPWHARCWVAGSWETPAPQPRLSSESSVVAEAHWRNRECGHNRWLP